MSEVLADIKEQMAMFGGKLGPKTIRTATVTAVNTDDTVAVKFSNERSVDDARLRAVVANGNKVVLIPQLNSVVIVGMLENSDEYVVLMVSEVSEIKYKIDTVEFDIDSAGFLVKKGSETLKKILDDLLDAINLLTVPTNVGPSGVPINATSFTAIKTRVAQILK